MGIGNEVDDEFATRHREDVGDRPVGQVTAQVSRLQHQIDQLDVHVNELRSRLGTALAPEEESDTFPVESVPVHRQPSELATLIEGCADRVQRLRYVVSAIRDSVDL